MTKLIGLIFKEQKIDQVVSDKIIQKQKLKMFEKLSITSLDLENYLSFSTKKDKKPEQKEDLQIGQAAISKEPAETEPASSELFPSEKS